MSYVPGETPAFDFGPEQAYSAELLADTVVWPLVDEFWRGNWRSEGTAGDEFMWPKHGQCGGRKFDVILEADCDERDRLDDKTGNIHAATLSIEETVTGLARGVLLQAVKGSLFDLFDQDPDHFDDEEYETLTELLENDTGGIEVKKGSMYSFDTDEGWHVELYRAIISGSDLVNVPLCQAEIDGASQDRLQLPDIEVIESGCVVLNAPKAIMKALSAVKARPILYH